MAKSSVAMCLASWTCSPRPKLWSVIAQISCSFASTIRAPVGMSWWSNHDKQLGKPLSMKKLNTSRLHVYFIAIFRPIAFKTSSIKTLRNLITPFVCFFCSDVLFQLGHEDFPQADHLNRPQWWFVALDDASWFDPLLTRVLYVKTANANSITRLRRLPNGYLLAVETCNWSIFEVWNSVTRQIV